jgi:hypothetical protein
MLARDMNRVLLLETRGEYIHVRSNAASMRRTVSSNSTLFMSLSANRTVVYPCERGYLAIDPCPHLLPFVTEDCFIAFWGSILTP